MLVTVSDRKMGVDSNNDGVIDYYNANVVTANDYYPFGQGINDRQFALNNSQFRYGFNNKEKDNDINGTSVDYDYGARIYDARVARFLSVDPLMGKYPELSAYQFASDNPISGIDLDGLEFYYAADGTYIGRGADPKNLEVRLAKVTGKTISGNMKVAAVDINGNIQKTWTVVHGTHSEFQQLAAFAYNETYSGSTHVVDKLRVANTIVNRKQKTLQEKIDNFRYNNDTEYDRMHNITSVPTTGTAQYAVFMNTPLEDRNKSDDMKAANAAAINALITGGIDYTKGLDGKIATQERGVGKGTTGLHNRFFTDFPTKKSNQILDFKNTTVPDNQNSFFKLAAQSLHQGSNSTAPH